MERVLRARKNVRKNPTQTRELGERGAALGPQANRLRAKPIYCFLRFSSVSEGGLEARWEEEESFEREVEEEMVEWAIRKAFLPPPWPLPREGAEKRKSRDSRKATEKELKVKISVNPSQFSQAVSLAYEWARKGYLARVRLIRLGDLMRRLIPLKRLRARGRIVRIELELEVPR